MLKIAMIGAGSIGQSIIDHFVGKKQLEIALVYDLKTSSLEEVNKKYSIEVESNFDKFLARIKEVEVSLVVEAAGVEAVQSFSLSILNEGIDLALISTGIFGKEDFAQELKEVAEQKNCKIYLPSGAIAGLDGIRAAAVYPLESVVLTTTKSPKSLGIEAKERKLIFKGTAREAIEKWPKNLNVGVSLAMAGIGIDETQIKLFVDPSIEVNTHEIEADGTFGHLSIAVESFPSEMNPKSSILASLSMINLLERLTSHIIFM
ncbi:MAG: aspartate dehydrogenase [Candidatus Heimdallarchaeota archaeon]|nr:aspartate dehydrogenase [Candidatus Heimdallarchaeota archaeon]MCK5049407.1 aspartate dehydrogenase [Candidatus Heimdallarchaeota archaeon]